jgi:hypothetical protein
MERGPPARIMIMSGPEARAPVYFQGSAVLGQNGVLRLV